MVVTQEIKELPLDPGDSIVAVVSHQGSIVVVTAQGTVFRIGSKW